MRTRATTSEGRAHGGRLGARALVGQREATVRGPEGRKRPKKRAHRRSSQTGHLQGSLGGRRPFPAWVFPQPVGPELARGWGPLRPVMTASQKITAASSPEFRAETTGLMRTTPRSHPPRSDPIRILPRQALTSISFEDRLQPRVHIFQSCLPVTRPGSTVVLKPISRTRCARAHIFRRYDLFAYYLCIPL